MNPSAPVADPLARSWFLRAVAAEAGGDLAEADVAYRWVLRLDGLNPWAWIHVARFHERQRRWEDAASAWTRAVTLEPKTSAAHAGLAGALGRAGDAAGELTHLEQALALGPDAATCERLFDLRRRALDGRAAEVLEVWRQLPLVDPVERLRRARAARAVGQYALALDDLVAIAESGRQADVGPLLVESAVSACRLDVAHEWSKEQNQPPRSLVPSLVDLAERVGDVGLAARLVGEAGLESSSNHPWYPAPLLPLPPSAHRLRAAQIGLRTREMPAAETLLRGASDDAEVQPWVQVLLGRVAAAKGERLSGGSIPPAHPAWGYQLALRFEAGQVSAQQVRAALASQPSAITAFADGLADALVRGPLPAARALLGVPGLEQPEVRGEKLVLPEAALGPWRRALVYRQVEDAASTLAPGDLRPLVRDYLDHAATDAVGWFLMARVDPDRAIEHLDRAISLDPCLGPALLARAARTAGPEALWYLERARAADPLSGDVRRALASRGMDKP